MKAKYTVSIADLKRRGACRYSIDLFEDTFGEELATEGVPVNKTNLRKANKAGLSLSWLLSRVENNDVWRLRRKIVNRREKEWQKKTGKSLLELSEAMEDRIWREATIEVLDRKGYL